MPQPSFSRVLDTMEKRLDELTRIPTRDQLVAAASLSEKEKLTLWRTCITEVWIKFTVTSYMLALLYGVQLLQRTILARYDFLLGCLSTCHGGSPTLNPLLRHLHVDPSTQSTFLSSTTNHMHAHGLGRLVEVVRPLVEHALEPLALDCVLNVDALSTLLAAIRNEVQHVLMSSSGRLLIEVLLPQSLADTQMDECNRQQLISLYNEVANYLESPIGRDGLLDTCINVVYWRAAYHLHRTVSANGVHAHPSDEATSSSQQVSSVSGRGGLPLVKLAPQLKLLIRSAVATKKNEFMQGLYQSEDLQRIALQIVGQFDDAYLLLGRPQ
mmetsp:Transcript_8587/g.21682  ORF Transcript_8587/g.21682 Transcript_8587/m.21682 type:complete len:326 (-) Transcript_8587:98-1075(-)